jgi:hypothetical protein
MRDLPPGLFYSLLPKSGQILSAYIFSMGDTCLLVLVVPAWLKVGFLVAG